MKSSYGQIGFNYDQAQASTSEGNSEQNSDSKETEEDSKDDSPDEVFVPNPKFYIPPGMELVRINLYFIRIRLIYTYIESTT